LGRGDRGAGERERESGEGTGDAGERKGGQSNSALKPDRCDGGGWRKNAATVGARRAVGLRAFLRLIKDIRGRLVAISVRRVLTEARNHHRVSYRGEWMKESSSFDLPGTLLLPAIVRNDPRCKLQCVYMPLFLLIACYIPRCHILQSLAGSN
jgi:hypothetical protein